MARAGEGLGHESGLAAPSNFEVCLRVATLLALH